MVTGSLIDGIQAVQVEWQAPPEAVDLSRLEGDQVLIASQSPEVLAWGTDWTLLNHTATHHHQGHERQARSSKQST